MSAISRRARPLPAAAVPDGCLSWDGVQARRWAQALSACWVPVRVPRRVVLGVDLCALVACCLLADSGIRPLLAAFLALQPVWLLVRPEVVRTTAAMQALMVVASPLAPPWRVAACGVLLAGACALAAHLRMESRQRQFRAALAAAGGVTARVPDVPPRRGRFFAVVGIVLFVVGAAAGLLAGVADAADDRQVGAAAGFFLAGLGLTALLSGVLGRRRAAALHREPAPVLRVLVREGSGLDTEVFAADDAEALRPLFTVSLTDVADEDETDDDEDEDDEDSDDEDLDDVLGRVGGDEPGPLREAVLYGAPFDGAEVLIVSAAEQDDEPPVVERSVGPVRPLSDAHVRRGRRAERSRVARDAVYEERSRAAAETVARAPYGVSGKGVRRWRAGGADWVTAALAVLWAGHVFWGETGVWRYGAGGLLGIVGVLMLPNWLAWRVTADRDGLWFNGLRRARHIAWDDIRIVECKGQELKIDSRRASFDEWSVLGFRWPWLERKSGFDHPYERTAAEITAMWREPAYRPLLVAGARERERTLWPLAVLVAVAWTTALFLLP
ncbi:hypothetical protein [Streptomyces sp. NBC_00005]|uniref:hypothetical protein n=1 Tax=Streptomyces sp. NBC_00005 TaxID=2903609 RepID=UPI00324E8108